MYSCAWFTAFNYSLSLTQVKCSHEIQFAPILSLDREGEMQRQATAREKVENNLLVSRFIM